jgi:mannose-6-phosphate isomerase-like protein (cupin superfamily)
MSASTRDFTHENLTAVEDSAPKFGFAGIQEARFATEDLDATQTGVSYHRVMAGKRQAFAHRHDAAEEVYIVLAGTGRLKLDDAIIDVRPLDAIRIAPGVTRQFEAGPEQLEFVAVGARHPGDGEILKDWWID